MTCNFCDIPSDPLCCDKWQCQYSKVTADIQILSPVISWLPGSFSEATSLADNPADPAEPGPKYFITRGSGKIKLVKSKEFLVLSVTHMKSLFLCRGWTKEKGAEKLIFSKEHIPWKERSMFIFEQMMRDSPQAICFMLNNLSSKEHLSFYGLDQFQSP